MILKLNLDGQEHDVTVAGLVIAGWAGRDCASIQAHIEELQEIGVSPPSSTPLFYRINASRLTTNLVVEVLGTSSSGEVEAVVLNWHGRLWIGVGSDHTDRAAEAVGVALSKQLCDKPVSSAFWAFDDLEGHWGQLQLRSRIITEDGLVAYQDGSTDELLPIGDLLTRYGDLPEGWIMFCGTVQTINGIAEANEFEIELHDPVLDRSLVHRYRIAALPVVQ